MIRAPLIMIALFGASSASGQGVLSSKPVDLSTTASKADVAAAQAQAAAAAASAAQAKAAADALAATLAGYATTSALTAVQAAIPVARSTVPMSDTPGGTVGTAGSYMPGNSQAPRLTRAAIVTTSSTGTWSVSWAMPLPSTPVTLPIPVNATTEPVVCNVATSTMTGATGRCWLARALPATLVALTALVTYDIFGAPATGIQVQVLAIPTTQ